MGPRAGELEQRFSNYPWNTRDLAQDLPGRQDSRIPILTSTRTVLLSVSCNEGQIRFCRNEGFNSSKF